MADSASPSASGRSASQHHGIPISIGAMLVTLGVVYGDIGTSPMYVTKALLAGQGGIMSVTEEFILGALSLVIWTVTLLTTVKYVLISLKADNHGEGGIFALYSIVRRCARWLIIPAMLGGSALLADGVLTPAVTITTAVEGLRTIPELHAVIGDNQVKVVIITLVIVCLLFAVQRAGTSKIGRAFGPVMTFWFLFLGVTGFMHVIENPVVLVAFNPLRGIAFLLSPNNHAGIMILGSCFLATTGAEALYSDMGHVGKANIYFSWPFVKLCLILNYLGQGAWIIANHGSGELAAITDLNPFFQMLPEEFRVFAVILSTFAAIIASQALITGSYSIVSEAIRLDLMPHMKINYPSETRGQIYIPLVNNIMWIGCMGVVLLFQSSKHMEAAYGLAITCTMLMTTLLLFSYLSRIRRKPAAAVVFLVFFGAIELMFFFSSLTKFFHGGYVTVLLATVLFLVMYIWRRGTAIERTQSVYLPVREYLDQLFDLSHDESYPLLADNLVFLTNDSSLDKLDRDILYSILDKRPKRARAYYFLNVQVTDEPYTHEYMVNTFDTDFVFKVQLRLGFRVNQRVNTYLYQIVEDLVEHNQLAPQNHKYSIYRKHSIVGDFRFCLIRKVLSPETDISGADSRTIEAKYFIRRLCGTPMRWYGLENSSVIFEYVPLFAKAKRQHKLTRIPIDANAVLAAAPKKVVAKPAEGDEDSDDEDIFSASMHNEREENASDAEKTLVGGDTASFKPLRIDEEDEDDEDSEEEELEYAVKAAEEKIGEQDQGDNR